jgi:hypothetical protein
VGVGNLTQVVGSKAFVKYRPDIDGLRAVAVLSVVVFHAFPELMKGGFIGVDIFFVISGFLISTIIFQNLDRGTFSFSEFYARRIRRIFPALLLVLIATYGFGWFALLADEYKQLGKHIVAGAGFVSNLVLWSEAGYFDNSAETKPLLHLWSLGIEEQFYIIWPLLVWVLWKLRLNLFSITFVIALVSFVLNAIGIKQDSVATFYSPQTRFWELLSGSILSCLSIYRGKSFATSKIRIDSWLSKFVHSEAVKTNARALSNITSFVGSSLLSYGFWRITKDVGFPGVWAIIPVLGSFLIILAGPKAWINRKILSNKILVWIGLISFPLYLWHWPLLSFARIVECEAPSRNVRLMSLALSIVLAWVTYKLIESPVRSDKSGKINVAVLVVLMAGVGWIGYHTYSRDGLSFRTKDREEFVNYFENSHPNWSYFKRINLSVEWRSECAFFNGKKYLEDGVLEGGVTDSKPVAELASSCYKRDPRFDKSVLIWGDSHAQTLSSGLVKFMPSNWQILQIASSACLPNPNIHSPSTESQCTQSNYFAMKTIKDLIPDVVVVAQANGHSIQVMNEISGKLKELGVGKILFLGPTPQWRSDLPKILARQLWVTKPKRTRIGVKQEVLDANNALLREFPVGANRQFVDVIGLFCDANGCLTRTGDDLRESITTWDYGHLTPSASRYLAQNLLVRRITEQ